MLAYHGQQKNKDAILAQLQAHKAADDFVQGQYWVEKKGCAVGCTLHNPDGGHKQYEEQFGIPEGLARLEDRIFEKLTVEESKDWPITFMSAIPVGADLSMVQPKFLLWLLENLPAQKQDKVQQAINEVKTLYQEWVQTGVKPSVERWKAAADVADAAATAAYAVYAAGAAATAAYAVYAADVAYAAYAADVAAAYAADAAADADAATRRSFWTKAAAQLVLILQESK